MYRFALMIAFAALAWSQSEDPFNRPPADVDKALRERVQAFFTYHISGEYRKAEALVAEDTKDYFYSHGKPNYISIEISKIEYSENFTQAKVIVICEQYFRAPGFNTPVKVPTPSTWKLEEGKWVWWIDPAKRNMTPFGPMKPGPMPEKGGSQVNAPASTAIPPSAPTSTDFLFKQVKIDKDQLNLKPGESAVVTITNSAPGVQKVLIRNKVPGVEFSFSTPTMRSGDTVTLTVKASADAKPGTLNVEVDPTGQILPIRVTINK